jgi:hypothetical protein
MLLAVLVVVVSTAVGITRISKTVVGITKMGMVGMVGMVGMRSTSTMRTIMMDWCGLHSHCLWARQ